MLTKPTLTNQWLHIDGSNMCMGRLASAVAILLRGKHKPTYSPHLLCGDKIVVTNVSTTYCTTVNKLYYHHSGYPGGIKSTSYEDLFKKDNCAPLFMAIKRMLNKSKLRKLMLRNLYLFPSDSHNLTQSLTKYEVK